MGTTGTKRKKAKIKKATRTATRRPDQRYTKPPRVVTGRTTETARELDRVVQQFHEAVEGLQSGLEKVRESLPDIISMELHRNRLKEIKVLTSDGILDTLQRLGSAFGDLDPSELPESLAPYRDSARMILEHICRVFGVQSVCQPGEMLTVPHDRVGEFDWSADQAGEFSFPVDVKVMRSGWRVGEAVLALPKAIRTEK